MSAYPSAIENFSALSGTAKLGPTQDHTDNHTLERDNIEAIETAIGTTSGTNMMKYLSVGKFAVSDAKIIGTYTGTASGTVTVDTRNPLNIVNLPATGSVDIAISNGTTGRVFMIDFVQSATGNGTPVLFGTIQAPDGTITFGTAADIIDTVGFVQINAGTYRAYPVGGNMS